MKEGDIISIKINRGEDGSEIDLDIGIHKLNGKLKNEVKSGHEKAQAPPMNLGLGFPVRVSEPELIEKTKQMMIRTYETVKSFLDNVTGDSTLWKSPPKPSTIALSNAFKKFRSSIKWEKLNEGCETYMQIKNVQYQSDQVKKTISLMIYLTIAGLLRERIAVKPYADGVMGFVRTKTQSMEELHPYSKKIELTCYFENFIKNYEFTMNNFNYISKDKSKFVIHVNTKYVVESPETFAVFTMIHEASHKFASTKDVLTFKIDDKPSKPKGKLITVGKNDNKIQLIWDDSDKTILFQDCLDNGCKGNPEWVYTYNADSVAALIYHYGNGG
jgi:hypothetical protein